MREDFGSFNYYLYTIVWLNLGSEWLGEVTWVGGWNENNKGNIKYSEARTRIRHDAVRSILPP